MFFGSDEEYQALRTKNVRRFNMQKSTEGRFLLRIEDYKAANKNILIHHFHWFLHNVIIHPLIGILPIKWTFELHDWSSKKINLKS